MRPIGAAYGLIGSFMVIERLLRQGKEAKSFEEGQADRGSTRTIGAAFGTALLALLIAPLLNRMKLGRIGNQTSAWSGIVIMLAGLSLRIWASRILGSFYTRTLRTSTEQHIIVEGPYRLVRNPGYLGDILLWFGAAIASANWIVLVVIVLPMLRAYRKRIEAEEAMLADTFPQEYKNYARRTWRLIPFLY
jgi:protein-S-isoprenylcysteine O-methyltransferase Ste14